MLKQTFTVLFVDTKVVSYKRRTTPFYNIPLDFLKRLELLIRKMNKLLVYFTHLFYFPPYEEHRLTIMAALSALMQTPPDDTHFTRRMILTLVVLA